MSASRSNVVRAIAAVVAVALCALLIASTGEDVPEGAVAKVGDTVIAKKDFDRMYATSAKSAAQQLGAVPELSDLPNFTGCVAQAREQQPEGGDSPSDSELRKRCEQTYEQVKQQVMQFLLQSQWILQEAEEQDIEVTDAEVVETFEQQKQEAFPKEKDYRKFLRDSGTGESQILFQIKIQKIQEELTKKIQEDHESVSEEDIEEYYEENEERFAQPAQRDLNIVLTKTEAKAERAKKELDGGAKFPAVAKKYSIDQASKANGGKQPGVIKGQNEKAFDDAIFSAERGEIEGPVQTQFGWYVFEVTDETPGSRQSLEAATETIRGLLRSERQQEGLQKFIEEFQEDFTDKTVCADDYVVAECDNGPKPTDTGPASGSAPDAVPTAPGVPPGGSPQGAPPQQGAPQGAPQQQAPTPQGPPPGAPQQAPPPPPTP